MAGEFGGQVSRRAERDLQFGIVVAHTLHRVEENARFTREEIERMLYWTLMFFVIAIVAGLLGFSGIAGGAAWIAQVLFFVFLVLLVFSLLFGRRAV